MENKDTKLKVIYDIKSCPNDINIDSIFNIMMNGGIIIYDSSLGGDIPQLIDTKELKLMDVAFWPKKDFEERFENLDKEIKNTTFSYVEGPTKL